MISVPKVAEEPKRDPMAQAGKARAIGDDGVGP
jgi:hypothetical protein